MTTSGGWRAAAFAAVFLALSTDGAFATPEAAMQSAQALFDAAGALSARAAAAKSGVAVATPAPRRRRYRGPLPRRQDLNPYARRCIDDFLQAQFTGPDTIVLGCSFIRGWLALQGVDAMIQSCNSGKCADIGADLIASYSEIKNEYALGAVQNFFAQGYSFNSGEDSSPGALIVAMSRVRNQPSLEAVKSLFARGLGVTDDLIATAAEAVTDGRSACVEAKAAVAAELSPGLLRVYCGLR